MYGAALALVLWGGVAVAAEPIRYGRDVRPILSEKCFHCHGQDKAKRKAGLRLDTFEGATATRKDGAAAVVAGRPDESELVARILSIDEDKQMPPPDSHRRLTDEQKQILRQWVAQGGTYEPHWAFVSPARVPMPAVAQTGWVRRPTDAFVLARLEREGLKPSAETQPERWLRRASFDLTGLPPSLDELDAFLADVRRRGETAYEEAANRLLASPRYGERLAQDWLDVARYADTHGFNNDSARSMWRWRDWVIDAFNDNLPYDRFIVEQLAGDLLPAPTLEQRLATGFGRNHVINSEGGIIDEEYRVEYVADRVRTLGLAWMGLTLECTRCHDHKYDPLSQRDYYRMYAFFNNVPEIGEDGRVANASPMIPAPTREQQRRLEELDTAIAGKTELLRRLTHEPGAIPPPAPATEPEGATAKIDLVGDKAWTFAAWVKEPGSIVSTMDLNSKPAANDHGRGAEVRITDEGSVELRLAVRWPAYAIQARSVDRVRLHERHHVVVVYDGSKKARGVRIFIDGRESSVEVEHDDLSSTAKGDAPRIGGQPSDLRFFPRQLDAATIASWAETLLPQDRELALRRTDTEFARAFDEREQLRQARFAIERDLPTAMVMVDSAPRKAHILVRGQYDLPGDAVEAGVPEALLGAWPADAPRNRLGLARWLTRPDHPLTARVVVNRFWQQLFGTGLVKTVEDFGYQGEYPSHPELLDWLARSFVDGGWDTKALLRDLVLSATYRQDSRMRPALRERDPENRLLARGPRQRLPAEVIRDNALAASGLLRHRLGGPSVFPFQPTDLYKGVVVDAKYPGTSWKESTGDDLFRRSLYTFWKRTVPHPVMITFDAPDREVCSARRPITNTPLQALTLMNETGAVEAARKLGQRMTFEGGTGDARKLAFGFRLATSRAPAAGEIKVLRRALGRFRRSYASDRKGAKELTGAPDRELAALTSVASLILNLDETITKH